MKKILSILTISVFLISCSNTVENINPISSKKIASKGLSYQDFQRVADKSINSIIRSGSLNNPKGTKYIVVVSDIVNDTMQNIDTAQLIKKIRIALLRSGKVSVTNGVGKRSDKMLRQLRKLRNHQEFDQRTIVGKNRMQAPDLSLSGRIIQKNIAVSGGKELIEYYFQLTLASVVSGLSIWEDEVVIGKRASGDSVSW